MKAYDFYLRGRHQRELRSDTALKAAIQYFSQAVAADSNYAAAYAGLSEACTNLAFSTNSAEYPRSKLLACSESAARKALELDDSLSDAHLALGFLRMGQHINLAASEKELKRALELDPGNRQAHEDLAIVYDATNRPDAAIIEARRAESLDPLSVTAIREVGRALYSARRYDEALTELNRARTMGPPVRNVPLIVAQVYAKQKKFPEAISEIKRGPSGIFAQAVLGHILGLAGDRQEASQILSSLIARFDSGTGSAFAVAVVYAGLHDYDNAFTWLEKSFEDSSIRANIMDPLFDDLRADRRFQPLRARLGLGSA
jgi:tetratricopeptide (TPR) repeat protein